MTDDRPAEAGPENPDAGVFGNLPGSRPGKRSPRRDAAPGTTRAAKARSEGTAKKRPATPGPQASASPPSAAEPTGAPGAPEAGGGLEDIAWAGVAVAAEAATLGVRLASRAIEALRGNSERS
jgi:hypothetical protein